MSLSTHTALPFTVLQVSDLHYSPDNLAEADRCLGAVLDGEKEGEVGAIAFTGDSTDHPLSAHNPSVLALFERVKQAGNIAPTIILQGTFSHEPPGFIQLFGLIGTKYPIYIADRIEQVGLDLNGNWTSDLSGEMRAVFSCLPTVNKADLLTTGVETQNLGEAMGDAIANVLASFKHVNLAMHQRGVPTIVLSHGTVSGSLTEHGVPMSGMDHEYTTGSLFAAEADAVMLGHLHLHQAWERTHSGRHQMIAYAGSTGRFHYGELGDKCGLKWTVGPNQTSFKKIVTPARRCVDLVFNGVPDMDALVDQAESLKGAFVRLRYCVDEEFAKTVDRKAIKEILKACAEVKIEQEILSIQRARAAGISKGSLQEQVNQWCQISGTSPDGLPSRVELLQSSTPEEIVNSVLMAA